MSVDLLIAIFGLIALACVMVFLAVRPGLNRRAEMTELLRRPLYASTPDADTTQLADSMRSGIVLPDDSIFISYRRADSADIVGRLYEHLVSSLGRRAVFKDVDSIAPGGDFRARLEQSLRACRVFICVMGDQWSGPHGSKSRMIDDPNDFVRMEVEAALSRKIPVIPVFVRGTNMPPGDTLPESLRGLAYRQGLPLRPDPDFRNDATRLIASVMTCLEQRS